jgi:hypothetical protein
MRGNGHEKDQHQSLPFIQEGFPRARRRTGGRLRSIKYWWVLETKVLILLPDSLEPKEKILSLLMCGSEGRQDLCFASQGERE